MKKREVGWEKRGRGGWKNSWREKKMPESEEVKIAGGMWGDNLGKTDEDRERTERDQREN